MRPIINKQTLQAEALVVQAPVRPSGSAPEFSCAACPPLAAADAAQGAAVHGPRPFHRAVGHFLLLWHAWTSVQASCHKHNACTEPTSVLAPAPNLTPISQDGRQFTVTVDTQNPSRLLLQDTASRSVYALQTKVDRVNINNSLAMRLLFGDERWVGQLRQVR